MNDGLWTALEQLSPCPSLSLAASETYSHRVGSEWYGQHFAAAFEKRTPQSSRSRPTQMGRQATFRQMLNWLATLVKLSGEPGQLCWQ